MTPRPSFSCLIATVAMLLCAACSSKSGGAGGDPPPPMDTGTTTVDTPPAQTAQQSCDALNGQTIGGATIKSATFVADTAVIGEHCKVAGAIHTSLRFEATLPTAWNRTLLYLGGGGFDGAIPSLAASFSSSALRGGYVMVASNGGHDDPTGAVFLDNVQAQKDFGYLSVHTVLHAVDAIVSERYGASPERHYFEGCSNGGREALIQASRWPDDFDGIVARAPAYSFTELVLAFNNDMKHQLGTPGGAISIAKANAIAAAALKKCDALDGLADKVISNVEACSFDPGTMLCTAGDNDGCLTSAQVDTARAVYSEFKRTDGTSVYPGWGPSGEDQGWPGWIIGKPGAPAQMFFSESTIRNWFVKNPTFDSLGFDPQSYLPQIAQAALILDASPNLKAFFARRGKLILVHGESDWAISYKGSIKYFNDVATAVGGTAERDQSMEFFLEPGVQHCLGGVGPDTVDLVDAVAKWVESGQRPSSANLVLTKLDASGKAVFARPMCRYPRYPRYVGAGDVVAASSYACTDP